jgi:nucleoside-diphosphate kinase
MAERQDDSMLFVVEWFDPMPQMKKKYLLKYFVDLHCAEMVDLKTKKMFLKKSPCPAHISKDDFYVGGKVLLYSRELDIVDYGDAKTRDRLHHKTQHVVAILPQSAYANWGKIIGEIMQQFNVTQIRSIQISPNTSDRICRTIDDHSRKAVELGEGVSLAMLILGENGFDRFSAICSKFYEQERVYIAHAKNSMQSSALQEIVFQEISNIAATIDSCTCCVIKPHAVKSKNAGAIIDDIISQGYEISGMRTLLFERVQAEEFLEVYKGVVPEYSDHVVQLCSGMSIALEIRAQQAVETFRVTAGPWDVDMAKELRPDSIRGKYGIDRILNAVHCTDLPDDAELECEYCFRLL